MSRGPRFRAILKTPADVFDQARTVVNYQKLVVFCCILDFYLYVWPFCVGVYCETGLRGYSVLTLYSWFNE